MKQSFLIQENHSRLVLFFAGWAMDEHPFQHLVGHCPADSDWMICYDYTDNKFDCHPIRTYKEIVLIGWSLGVYIANRVTMEYELPIVQRIAINGTLFPMDELKGIPPAIFEGTINKLDERSLMKFRKRMCNTPEAYQDFLSVEPYRDISLIAVELAHYRTNYLKDKQEQIYSQDFPRWDCVVIGKSDRIFSPENQLCAWKELADRIIIGDIAHYDTLLPFIKRQILES